MGGGGGEPGLEVGGCRAGWNPPRYMHACVEQEMSLLPLSTHFGERNLENAD